MKSNHQVNVVRIGEILPHPNADKLEITMVGGYQVVIGKDNFKTGDLAVYIQPDSVVPQTEPFKFIWQDHVDLDGTVPEKRRRITVKRLRKEYSEGLLMPVADFPILFNMTTEGNSLHFKEGDDVAQFLGVTHYVPEFDRESTVADTANAPRLKRPKTLRGWFHFVLYKLGLKGHQSQALNTGFTFPVYDVDALKNNKRLIQSGDIVHVTEKIHGSNARYVFIDGAFYAGSRTQWKKKGGNVWWNAADQYPEIEEWCRENEGKVLYGEVGPTQKGFRYSAEGGKTFFFAFDVYDPTDHSWSWPADHGFATNVPSLGAFGYGEDLVKQLADGDSLVPNAKHIREGVVLRNKRNGVTLKIVSNKFLEKDSQ